MLYLPQKCSFIGMIPITQYNPCHICEMFDLPGPLCTRGAKTKLFLHYEVNLIGLLLFVSLDIEIIFFLLEHWHAELNTYLILFLCDGFLHYYVYM